MTIAFETPRAPTHPLADPRRAIKGPWTDAALIWGAPLWVFAGVALWAQAALFAPAAVGQGMLVALLTFTSVITSAHLIAVLPRSHFNADVFAQHRLRFTAAPIAVFLTLALVPGALPIGLVLAFFWDVYHSAMQTYGLGRIYDMKAGGSALAGRGLDKLVNLVVYVGAIAMGASLLVHLGALEGLSGTSLAALAALPPAAAQIEGWLHGLAAAAIAGAVAVYVLGWRRLARAGHAPSPHKLALLVCTGVALICAWGLSSPLVGFAAVNIYHALQYFAIVWAREGDRIAAPLTVAKRGPGRALALTAFLAACAAFGIGYHLNEGQLGWPLALFVTVSLMHFWYDGFVWSVRKKPA